jgi:hypothetical protein
VRRFLRNGPPKRQQSCVATGKLQCQQQWHQWCACRPLPIAQNGPNRRAMLISRQCPGRWVVRVSSATFFSLAAHLLPLPSRISGRSVHHSTRNAASSACGGSSLLSRIALFHTWGAWPPREAQPSPAVARPHPALCKGYGDLCFPLGADKHRVAQAEVFLGERSN